MKVFWLVNTPLPEGAAALGLKAPPGGSWLSAQAACLRGRCELVVCHVTGKVKRRERVEAGGVAHIFLPNAMDSLRSAFEALLAEEKPDVVHVHGTEYEPNTLLVDVCGGKCAVSLQGIMTEYAKHYDDGLPARFERVNPAVALMKKLFYADSVALGKQAFARQGVLEVAALEKAAYILGRTAWDKAFAQQTAPAAQYRHVGENLRGEFYEARAWEEEACEKHSIFVSQASYPIKGFHMLLAALPALAEQYPDIHVYVGGARPFTFGNRALDAAKNLFFEYHRYVDGLIKQNGLARYITYTGPLDAWGMVTQFRRCNVFLSPASIENSPNSVGEAMMLGVPVVASDVGGVSSMLVDGDEGLLYGFGDTGAMAEKIGAVFNDAHLAKKLSQNARNHAGSTHDRDKNTADLLAVYEEMTRL